MSSINVERGCGRRKKGGFYLEAKTAPGGTLNAVTYCFGSHVDGSSSIPANNLIADIPARGVWLGHFPASFLTGEWMPTNNSFTPSPEHTAVYEGLKTRFISPYCLGDKVSKQFYSCASFIKEAQAHGPSRKIPQDIAKLVSKILPIPILFFFDLPLFHSDAQRDALLVLCGIKTEGLEYEALWKNSAYGISIDYPNSGESHYMTHLTGYLQSDKARTFLNSEGIQTAVMPGCICWLNQVRYMLSDDDDPNEKALEMMQYGIEVVDLETHEDEY